MHPTGDDNCRLTIELRCEAGAIAGAATDEHGRTQRFDGWLALITLVQDLQRRAEAAGNAGPREP